MKAQKEEGRGGHSCEYNIWTETKAPIRERNIGGTARMEKCTLSRLNDNYTKGINSNNYARASRQGDQSRKLSAHLCLSSPSAEGSLSAIWADAEIRPRTMETLLLIRLFRWTQLYSSAGETWDRGLH